MHSAAAHSPCGENMSMSPRCFQHHVLRPTLVLIDISQNPSMSELELSNKPTVQKGKLRP